MGVLIDRDRGSKQQGTSPFSVISNEEAPRVMPKPRVIAIGASAGGVDALKVLVAALPADLEASVLIVLHLAPTSPGRLPQILGSVAALPVAVGSNEEIILPGRIYVAPPNRHMLVTNEGRLVITLGPEENHARPAINPLFRSAALAFGPRLIGVVLTGYLDDGAAGLLAIKQGGGLAVVQDPKEAEAPSMPLNALRAVRADYCLPLREIGPLLASLAASPNLKREFKVKEAEPGGIL
jgi:two-component system chemotaxis response regulator CheB